MSFFVLPNVRFRCYASYISVDRPGSSDNTGLGFKTAFNDDLELDILIRVSYFSTGSQVIIHVWV